MYEGIISHFIKGLSNSSNECNKQLHSTLTEKLHQTIQDQTQIGWDEYRHGSLAKGWAEVQLQYERSTKTKTNSDWNTMFTKTVIQYVYDTWKFRNEKRHGTVKKEEWELRHQQLCNKANELYNK